jgi:hypothetical protein
MPRAMTTPSVAMNDHWNGRFAMRFEPRARRLRVASVSLARRSIVFTRVSLG